MIPHEPFSAPSDYLKSKIICSKFIINKNGNYFCEVDFFTRTLNLMDDCALTAALMPTPNKRIRIPGE